MTIIRLFRREKLAYPRCTVKLMGNIKFYFCFLILNAISIPLMHLKAIPSDCCHFVKLSKVVKNKNALTAVARLACLEIRSRKEEAINSARNRIYSLKVFYFLLYRRRYLLFVSELI